MIACFNALASSLADERVRLKSVLKNGERVEAHGRRLPDDLERLQQMYGRRENILDHMWSSFRDNVGIKKEEEET